MRKRWQQFSVPLDLLGFGHLGVAGRGGGKSNKRKGDSGENLSEFLFYEAAGEKDFLDFVFAQNFLNYWSAVNDIREI